MAPFVVGGVWLTWQLKSEYQQHFLARHPATNELQYNISLLLLLLSRIVVLKDITWILYIIQLLTQPISQVRVRETVGFLLDHVKSSTDGHYIHCSVLQFNSNQSIYLAHNYSFCISMGALLCILNTKSLCWSFLRVMELKRQYHGSKLVNSDHTNKQN